jgi:hypothetical protein
VRNVLENVSRLLEGAPDYFSPVERYILGMGVLFHDVGNLHGRRNHSSRVAHFYDYVHPQADRPQEKLLVVQIAQAHSGTTRDGSRDTLAAVPEESHLDGRRVRPREIAAVIRFADELAEGPQRTSHYLRATSGYSAESTPFHDYASATDVFIDGLEGRIAVTYHFDVKTEPDFEREIERLEGLLDVVHARLTKMNLERRYARFYCAEPLVSFGEISVRINIQLDGEFLDLDLETRISDAVDLDRPPDLLFSHQEGCSPAGIVARVREMAADEGRS